MAKKAAKKTVQKDPKKQVHDTHPAHQAATDKRVKLLKAQAAMRKAHGKKVKKKK